MSVEGVALTTIRSTLLEIGAIENSRIKLFASKTRDRQVPVWHDPLTGVIFIDDFYAGDEEYVMGDYRPPFNVCSYEDHADNQRRAEQFAGFYTGRSVIDFGCGNGHFLQNIRSRASRLQAVELQTSYRHALNEAGIPCFAHVDECLPADVVFLFHVLEHLPDPIPLLRSLREKVAGAGGYVIVEVPHARDFLIAKARCESFIEFTLWSQHLVLHTRDSLERLMVAAGLTEVSVLGVQRYGLANHFNWLLRGEPGGHKGPLALLQTESLNSEYAAALARLDATDTLVAIARA